VCTASWSNCFSQSGRWYFECFSGTDLVFLGEDVCELLVRTRIFWSSFCASRVGCLCSFELFLAVRIVALERLLQLLRLCERVWCSDVKFLDAHRKAGLLLDRRTKFLEKSGVESTFDSPKRLMLILLYINKMVL